MFNPRKISRMLGIAACATLLAGSFGAMAARTVNNNASDGSQPLTDRNVNAGTGTSSAGAYSVNASDSGSARNIEYGTDSGVSSGSDAGYSSGSSMRSGDYSTGSGTSSSSSGNYNSNGSNVPGQPAIYGSPAGSAVGDTSATFNEMDLNRDGVVSQDEFLSYQSRFNQTR